MIVIIGGYMTIIKIINKDGEIGTVDVESWANPKTQLLDVVDEQGNSFPEYKENLEYIGVEEL
ncbi:MAG: hypothetical protein UR93_C0009G0004 [Berkelbacteria bacterium GW2011_GWA2_35_9]|uniref:Uncharacterized protein n=1 Tax=Berkelbacteria bacterium GW2011_GWA2_35_9 TaxID=1618333 RepID=A0A0G0DIS1_9BACT|nr:MAG: hypothetical protein UR93_C0009G0004 [Berkelbacteria bacterium GW2011_GWA2_35_9]